MNTSANGVEGETDRGEIDVRDATVDDVAEVATLAASAYRETYRTMIDADVIEAVVAQTCTAEAFTQLLEAATSGAAFVLVATEHSRIVAFLDFRFEGDRAE